MVKQTSLLLEAGKQRRVDKGAAIAAESWQRSATNPWWRQLHIFSVAVRFIWFLASDRLWGNLTPRQHHRRAAWLVRQLLALGPTFIKIGQALSTRADLLPLAYVQKFSELQDKVPPFAASTAIAVVEGELGERVETLFQSFEREPIAAASLGQVHRARLHSGEEVVVKVQRPGLEALFNLDFEVLHRLTRLLNRWVPPVRKYNLESLYQEFFALLFQEIDYIHEGKNADRFRENFKGFSSILVPKIYWRYTTRRVLALEYLPGIKVSDRRTLVACGLNPDRIIQLGVCSYLKQLLEDGFFQSDPHPGNMAVSLQGELIFYDFGTMAEVKSMARGQMVRTFFAVLRKDTAEVVETLMYMGLLEPLPDITPVKRIVQFLLDRFRERPVNVREFEAIGSELYVMFEQQPFRLPAQMMFVIKSLTTLDGIARALDPNYNLLAASRPFIKRLASSPQGQGNLVRNLLKQARSWLRVRRPQLSRAEVLSQRVAQLEQEELQQEARSQAQARLLKRMQHALNCLLYGGLLGLTLLGGAILLAMVDRRWALVAFGLSGLWLLLLVRSLILLAVQGGVNRRSKAI